MKAAIVEAAGGAPVYRDFDEPVAGDREVLIDVTAAPLSQITRARASGTHYSSSTVFPFVAGLMESGGATTTANEFILSCLAYLSAASRCAPWRAKRCALRCPTRSTM